VATSSSSADTSEVLPLASVTVTVTCSSVTLASSSLVPTIEVMPRRLNARASSRWISASSRGTRPGRTSTIVTSAPMDRQKEANSTPTAPAPSTITDLGR
jgi:hypothetical protein